MPKNIADVSKPRLLTCNPITHCMFCFCLETAKAENIPHYAIACYVTDFYFPAISNLQPCHIVYAVAIDPIVPFGYVSFD